MPTIRFGTTTSTDALANRKFNIIPQGGAIVNVWASSVTNGDTFGLSIGDRDIVVNGTEMNIEAAADVIDVARDQMVFNEIVGPGQLFLPVTVTTEAQFIIHLRYL
jgi:hypothetical protein